MIKTVKDKYLDLQVEIVGRLFVVKDRHGNEVLRAQYSDEDSGWYHATLAVEWMAEKDMTQQFRTQRAMFLYAQYVVQVGEDFGY